MAKYILGDTIFNSVSGLNILSEKSIDWNYQTTLVIFERRKSRSPMISFHSYKSLEIFSSQHSFNGETDNSSMIFGFLLQDEKEKKRISGRSLEIFVTES